jgi:putative chitinase
MSLIGLQKKIGVTPDGSFGPTTMRKAMEFYKFTPIRAAHFFAQTSHETGNFTLFTENLNYSASGLLGIFSKYFTQAQAREYQRQPEKIANRVYANRMGNGTEASGDGWKYRGRGALQLTGKSNYIAFADYLKNPEIVTNPNIVATDYSFESAVFFFDRNKLWTICDRGISDEAITLLSRRINGGNNGLADRITKTKKYYEYVR